MSTHSLVGHSWQLFRALLGQMRRVVVWLQDSVVELFDFAHLADLVALDGVLAAALDVDGNANAERDNGDHESNGNDHGDLAII